MRKIFITVCLFIMIISYITAEEEDSGWFWDKPIADIVFIGLDTISENEVEGITSPYIGKKMSEDIYNDIYAKIWALGFFSNLTGNAEPADN